MDLRSELEARKIKLKATKTILTNELGERYEILNGVTTKLSEKCSPFIVDLTPDLQIAQVLQGLFISSQDPVTSEELLTNHRIHHILSLGIEPSIKFEGIQYHFLNFLDLPDFDISPLLQSSIRLIDDYRRDNILVHCNAGVSRSATVIIAYLMAHKNINYDEAYKKLKLIRNCIKPNDGFVRQLREISTPKNLLLNKNTKTENQEN